MRRRTLLKRALTVALPLIPTVFRRSSENDPGPKAGYEFVYIGDVPSGATVAPIDEYKTELEDDLETVEQTAADLDEPGDKIAIGRLPISDSVQDYTPLPYSRPSNGPDGYYVDVRGKVLLITSGDELDQYPGLTDN